MAKRLSKWLLAAGAVIVVLIGSAFIAKTFWGQKIMHYKQYLLPCEGRVVTLGEPYTISFYILDEEEISELASKENILGIHLIGKNGERCDALDWSIDPAGFYQGSAYSAKSLNVTLAVEQEIVVDTLEIIYPDTKETMKVGELTLTAMESNPYAASTQITSTVDTRPLPGHEYSVISSLHVLGPASFREGFTITHIDLGIQGLGVEPSTVKFFEGTVDIGPKFTEDPENAPFLAHEPVEELPAQNVSIDIETDDQERSFMIPIRHDKSYNTQFSVKYCSPIYTCIDHQTGEEYLYFESSYSRYIPPLLEDEQARTLLEKFGI